ncbi:MAG: hypothetical protein UY50_C0011G0023 [Parcubacteria group bacterium GW2011_GWA2_49_9]|nr:MAG: hypothetical protein UY50_C0011G0023 [Parcubacteria group bacterium GW2011_GWA2_49_9]
MKWMMLICCLLPVGLLLFAGGTLFSGGYLWPILFGIFVVVHLAMMFRGHKKCAATDANTNNETNVGAESRKDRRGSGDCCR